MTALTPYQQALVILSEECAEIQQAASKVLRFQQSPDQLQHEVGDLLAVIRWFVDHNHFDTEMLVYHAEAKVDKLKMWSNMFDE